MSERRPRDAKLDALVSLRVENARLSAEVAALTKRVADLQHAEDVLQAVEAALDSQGDPAAEVATLRAERDDYKTALAAEERGHLLRCARVDGVWSCHRGCPAAELVRLRAQVEELAGATKLLARISEELGWFTRHGDECPAREEDGCDASGDDDGCECFLLLKRDVDAALAKIREKSR